jgi:hypothetical protein
MPYPNTLTPHWSLDVSILHPVGGFQHRHCDEMPKQGGE